MQFLLKSMNDFERGQILCISDDIKEALPYLHFVYNTKRSSEYFSYLIKNRLTGKRFMDFVKGPCKNSMLDLLAYLILKTERNKELRPVYRNDLN